MSVLEPPYGARDSGDMAARIAGLSAQIEDALQRLAREPWRPPVADPALLALGGLGGSAIAGDLTAGLYGDRLPRPLAVVRDYRWPAWVGKDALVLLSSYSGGTEETLALYRQAGARGIPRLALTSGGTLGAWCARDRVGVHVLPGGAPPRAALFSSWVALTALVHALGWADDPAPLWREAAVLLRSLDGELSPGAPEGRNPAKRLARALHGKLVLVYSGTERVAPVGVRVRQQLNENAKLPAHSAAVPELDHNEIVGWERPGPLHQTLAVLVLRDAEDAPAVARRLDLTAEYARRQGAAVHEWESRGAGRIARLASLVQFGDYLSLYLALLGGADPTPIPSIDDFKRRLATPGDLA